MKLHLTISDFKWPVVLVCALLTYVAIVVFRENSMLALFSVVSLGVIMLRASWSWEHVAVYAALFLVAIITETLCVYLGIWSYSMQGIFGVPLWVPFMWSNSGLFVIELKEAVDGYIGSA